MNCISRIPVSVSCLVAASASTLAQATLVCPPSEIVGRVQRDLSDPANFGTAGLLSIQFLPTGTPDVYEVFATSMSGLPLSGFIDQTTNVFTPNNVLAGLGSLLYPRAMPGGKTVVYQAGQQLRLAHRPARGLPFGGSTVVVDGNGAPYTNVSVHYPYLDEQGVPRLMNLPTTDASVRIEIDPVSPQFGSTSDPQSYVALSSIPTQLPPSLLLLLPGLPLAGDDGRAIGVLVRWLASTGGSFRRSVTWFQPDMNDGPKSPITEYTRGAFGGCWFTGNLLSPPNHEQDFVALPNQSLSANAGGRLQVLGGRCPGGSSGFAALFFGQVLPGPLATPFGMLCVDSTGGVTPAFAIDGTYASGGISFPPLPAALVGLSISMQAVSIATCVPTPAFYMSNEATLTIRP